MGINENKLIVLELTRLTTAGKFAEAAALMADDVEHWLQGVGVVTKEQVGQLVAKYMSHFKGPFQLDVVGLTAEGDRVAAEVRSHGELLNGQLYENTYHILYRIRDGKIFCIREYLDTQHAAETEAVFAAMDAGSDVFPAKNSRPAPPPLPAIRDLHEAN